MNDFKKLLATRFLFSLGVNMQAVLVGWRMYEITHEPWHLGILGLTEAVPALGLAIFAGYLVDRTRPQRVYLGVLFGSLLAAAFVMGSQWPALALAPGWQVLALYASSFVSGMARGFAQPAMASVMPRLMARAQLGRASAWMASSYQTAGILGPAVGGLVFGWTGVFIATVIPCVILIAAIGAWLMIEARIQPPAGAPRARLAHELLSGARFVFRHPILLPALSLDMLSVLFGGVEALLPVFASDILLVGPQGLGALRAAPALGSALASFGLTRVDIRARAGRWLFAAVFGFGLCILAFGLSTSYWISFAALALSGACDGVSVVIRSTAVQLVSPDHMRGRISAINSIFIGSSNELGEFESGMAAHIFGTVPAVLLGGAACLGTVVLVGWRCGALRGLNLIDLEREAPST